MKMTLFLLYNYIWSVVYIVEKVSMNFFKKISKYLPNIFPGSERTDINEQLSSFIYFNEFPEAIKNYIFLFLPLQQYNHLYLMFRVEPNYQMYFNHNPHTAPVTMESLINRKIVTVGLVRYINERLCGINNTLLMHYAIKNKYFELFKFVYTILTDKERNMFFYTLEICPNIEDIKFLHNENAGVKYNCYSTLLRLANESKNDEIIHYLKFHEYLGLRCHMGQRNAFNGYYACKNYRYKKNDEQESLL